MNRTFNKLAIAIAAALAGTGAWAVDSGVGSMDVSASIAPECAVSTGSTMAFGALKMVAAGVQDTSSDVATGNFSAICTNGTSTPKLSFTSANGTVSNTFRLVGGTSGETIDYSLANNTGNAPIAYGTAATFTGLTADGTAKTLTLKGTIVSSEKAGKPVQAYSDTITITSSYTP